jgi:5-formyltetrahydrofolate cyclo-ligase
MTRIPSTTEGKTLFTPRIVNDRMDFLKVHGEEDILSFSSGAFGIKEPSLELNGEKRQSGTHGFSHIPSSVLIWISVFDDGCETLDLILMPGKHFTNCLSATC